MKSTFMQDFVKPFVVLVAICVAASLLLGVVNALTAGTIAANEQAAMEATRKAVLPGSGSFTEIEADPELKVDSIYKEDSGLGYVITASYKGYGGNVVVTVGFDAQGTIVGVEADVSSETQGIGSKAGEVKHLAQYYGEHGNAQNAELITSATYSSKAVHESVDAAINAYNTVCKEAK